MTPKELRDFMQKWNLKQRHIVALFAIPQPSVSRFLKEEREIKGYYSKTFYYFSLLSGRQQKKEIDAVREV